MRIGFFSWESLNSIPVGGVAAHVTELSKALARLGHEVHVFTRNSGGQAEHEQIDGVHEHRVCSPHCDDFVEYMDHMGDSLVGCFHWTEHQFGGFDVLHGHDWHVVNALANIKHHKGYGFFWTCHSTEWGRSGCKHNPSWFSARVKHREWLGGYLSKRVITVSHVMTNELLHQYQVPGEKIDVVYNGINLDEFSVPVDAGRVKEQYGVWALDPVVLFVGRMSYQKGPDLLVEAIPNVLRQHPSTTFFFVGRGDMLGHVQGRGGFLGGSKVRVLGYVSNEERARLFRACDIVCVPSRNEPFGIVTLEAWASGKPVVATDVGGSSEIIDNFVNGVKVYVNPESIAWGINYLLSNPQKISVMGSAGREVAKEFSWDNIAKRTLQVYGENLD